MAYMKTETYTSGVNILASEVGLVEKTFQGTQAMADTVGNKKIIKKGKIVPTNDTSAKGIVFEDVDITDDEKKPISIIIAGRVIENNLPETVNSGAKTALEKSGIHFD